MSALNLDDAWAKLEWAKKHFETLRPMVEVIEERDDHDHCITVDINAQTGEYTFHVTGLEPIDRNLGLILGDCVHNARTALDYLMVRLYALALGKDPINVDAVQFPIHDKWGRYSTSPMITELRKHLGFSGYLARVEELQPFNNPNPSIWGVSTYGVARTSPIPAALYRLASLDNLDKHRVLNTAWYGCAWLRGVNPDFPTDFKHMGGTSNGGPLEDGAEIGGWQFEVPLPSRWEPTQMEMKRAFPLEVSIGDASPFKGVLEVLPLCIWGVEAVLTIFQPVFSHGRPPLPVTAIPPWEDPLFPRMPE